MPGAITERHRVPVDATSGDAAAAGDASMKMPDSELSADVVRAWVEEKRRLEAEEARRRERTERAEQERMRQHFMELDVPDDAMTHVAGLVRRAAEAGENQALVVRFPAAWLPDRGRAINARAEDWHAQLDGFAKRAYDFYERELKPRGFRLRAEIISWLNGMPGEVGFFLQWNGPQEE